MSEENDFEPRLGRIRNLGDAPAKRFLTKVRRSVARYRKTLRRGRSAAPFGRGWLKALTRHPFAHLRTRRVAVKIRYVKLAGAMSVMKRARAHLLYLERDGVEKSGEKGRLYGPDGSAIDREEFLEQSEGDRHQFRLIVSPEEGHALEDLSAFARDVMAAAEEDLGTKLDWAAVNHFNTEHPHIHIVLRGRADDGSDLVIARNYIAYGFRRRAEELATLELGQKSDREIADALSADVEKQRFTELDRMLLRRAENDLIEFPTSSTAYDRFERAVLTGRLEVLERMGLAAREDPARWRLDPGLEGTLRELGRRGDIINAMHRAFEGRRPSRDFAIFDAADETKGHIFGRVAAAGFEDELKGTRHLIIDGADGRAAYVSIGVIEPGAEPPVGAIVRVAPARAESRPADRTIERVARRNGGLYSDLAHQDHDRRASAEHRLAYKRRLEALRRAGAVERLADGRFSISEDFLERAARYEARNRAPVVQVLAWRPLDQLVEARSRTFLDDAALTSEARVATGFGAALDAALARRRVFLLQEGLAREEGGSFLIDEKALTRLSLGGRDAAGRALAKDIGKSYVAAHAGMAVEGVYRGPVDLASGRYALVERSKEFTLVPWRPLLERRRGLDVAGTWRGRSISWIFGRNRTGPEIP